MLRLQNPTRSLDINLKTNVIYIFLSQKPVWIEQLYYSHICAQQPTSITDGFCQQTVLDRNSRMRS